MATPMPIQARRDEWRAFEHHLTNPVNKHYHHKSSLYNTNCIGNKDVLALTEVEPAFDAANILRANDDVLYLVSNSGNKLGSVLLQEALGDKDRISLDAMIKTLNKWCVGVDVFWCQGPLFDYAILQNFYAQMGIPVPWNYWQIRDSRTLFSLVPRDPNEKRTGLHNALEDCYFQAKKVQRVYKELGIKNVRY